MKDKVIEIIDKYKEQLLDAGIKIEISSKNYEVFGREYSSRAKFSFVRIHPDPRNLIKPQDRALETKNKYRKKDKSYQYIVLSVLPTNGKEIPEEDCKEYSFPLCKVSLGHMGQETSRTTFDENKILKKIEKRIQKILNKSKKTGVSKTCKNTLFDAPRYSFFKKYEYKQRFCGKSKSFWDTFFEASICVLVIVFLLVLLLFIK